MRKIIVKGLCGSIRALLKHIAQSPGVFLSTELQTVDLELAKIIRAAQSALHCINSNLKFSGSAKTFQLSLIEFLWSALWISGHCFQFVKVGFDEQIADVDGLFATHWAWKSNFLWIFKISMNIWIYLYLPDLDSDPPEEWWVVAEWWGKFSSATKLISRGPAKVSSQASFLKWIQSFRTRQSIF